MAKDGVVWSALSDVQCQALVEILRKVRMEHGARMTFLVDACGRPLALSSTGEVVDLDGLASLCASAVAASTRLAQILGAPGAGLVLQHGDRDVLFLETSGHLVVAVALDAIHPRGLERIRAKLRLKRALTEIQGVLDCPAHSPAFSPPDVPEIEALLRPLEAGGS